MNTPLTVIADDFSGAAECAGVGFRHGLSAVIYLSGIGETREEVQVLDTDTRWRDENEVPALLGSAASHIAWRPGGLFKKVDSVLRGPVITELESLLEWTGLSRALLVPCNPASGRCIESGVYTIRGTPLHLTEFARDPRHPVISSHVLELLHPPPSMPVSFAAPGRPTAGTRVIVGEASSPDHLEAWARQLDDNTLAAGSAAFLAALLESQGYKEQVVQYRKPEGRRLIVSGTVAEAGKREMDLLKQGGVPVVSPPEALARSRAAVKDRGAVAGRIRQTEEWARAVVSAFERSDVVAVRTGGLIIPLPDERPACLLSEVVASVLESVAVDQVWIEGGETGSALARRLGWNRLAVSGEIGPGVVQLTTEGGKLVVNVKPGSYPWPPLFAQ